MKLYYRVCAEKRAAKTWFYVEKHVWWMFWKGLDACPLFGPKYFSTLEEAMVPIHKDVDRITEQRKARRANVVLSRSVVTVVPVEVE